MCNFAKFLSKILTACLVAPYENTQVPWVSREQRAFSWVISVSLWFSVWYILYSPALTNQNYLLKLRYKYAKKGRGIWVTVPRSTSVRTCKHVRTLKQTHTSAGIRLDLVEGLDITSLISEFTDSLTLNIGSPHKTYYLTHERLLWTSAHAFQYSSYTHYKLNINKMYDFFQFILNSNRV